MANQYGIDLGNIMSTASNLKTAKLNLETKDYMLTKQKELDQLTEEKQNNEGVARIAIQLSQLPPEQQQVGFEQAVSKMPPEAQEFVKSKGYTAQDLPFIINEALTTDQLYERYIKNPKDLEAKTQIENLKASKKQEAEELKQSRAIELEEIRQEGREDIELLKQQVPKGKVGEFERIMGLLDNPKLTDDKRKRYKARLDKLAQADMSSLLINANTVKNEQTALATDLGLTDPYQLSTIDITTLTPEQQARANQTASIIVKGLGANAKAAEKKMGQYGAMANQMQNALNHYQDVGEFRVADEMTKKYFSNYFGLSDDELKSTQAAQAFQSMMNIKIKADSGSAVSGKEMVRNVLEVASPFMDKKRIVSGVRNVAERYKGELESLKNVMGPIAFNLKYGGVLKNYDNIIDAANTATTEGISPTGKTLQELRGGEAQKQVARTGMSNGRRVVQYTDGSVEYAD